MTQRGINVSANVEVTKIDKFGNEVEARNVHNLVVNQGLDLIVNRLFIDSQVEEISIVSYGNDNTAVQATDTALGGFLDRTHGYVDATGSTGVVDIIGWFSVTGSQTAQEVGLHEHKFNSWPLVARATFSSISLTTGDSLKVKWTMTYTDGGA